MKRIPLTLVLAVPLLFLSCGKENPVAPHKDPPPPPVVTGSWTADLLYGELFTMVLNENNRNVSGTGYFYSINLYVSVTGRHEHPAITLTLSAPGYEPAYITGTVESETAITGKIDSSGFFGEPIILERKTDLAWIPAGIQIQQLSFRTLKVTWTDTTANRTGFLIKRAVNDHVLVYYRTIGPSVPEFIDTATTWGSFAYSVSTLTVDDTSRPQSAMTYIENPLPQQVTLTRYSPDTLQLTWVNGLHVNHTVLVERELDSSSTVLLAALPWGNFSVKDGITGYHTYRYAVRAVLGPDTSERAYSQYYRILDPIPTDFAAQQTGRNLVELTWNAAIPFATGVLIERSINDGPFEEVRQVPVPATSTVDTIGTFGSYGYRLSAVAGTTQSPSILLSPVEITPWLPGNPSLDMGGYSRVHQLPDGDILAYRGPPCQRYDVNTGIWHSTGVLSADLGIGSSVELQDGRILNAAGQDVSANEVNEIFDPATDSWHTVASMLTVNVQAATVYPVLTGGGSVLVPGLGSDDQIPPAFVFFAQEYFPDADSFAVLQAPPRVFGFQSSLLNNGKVLIMGGFYAAGPDPAGVFATDSSYLFDPSLGQWSATGLMNEQRVNHRAFPFQGGAAVVVFGGSLSYGSTPPTTTYERYDMAGGMWTALGTLPKPAVYAAVKVSDDTLYALLGEYSGATGFYRYTNSNNHWAYVSNWPNARSPYPLSLHRLPDGRFIALVNGSTRPEIYVP